MQNVELPQIQIQALTQHLERLMSNKIMSFMISWIKWSKHIKKVVKIEEETGEKEDRMKKNKDN